MPDPVQRVAIFDLDGTLTWRDSFVGFLIGFLRRRPIRLLQSWRLLPAFVRYVATGCDRGMLKEHIIQIFMRGERRTDIDVWAQRFAEKILRTGCRAGGLAVLRDHQQAHDFIVLLSASPDLYVPAIGRLLGVNRVVCTEVAFEGDRLEGTLLSPNRRGEEKRRCLQRLKSEFPAASFSAYGNSDSDLPHLREVDRPLLVNASSSARREAQRLSIPCDDWC